MITNNMNTPGTLDTTFGINGKFATTTPNPLTTIVQPDGKTISLATTGGLAIQRFNTNGSLDTSFGSSGTINGTFELGSTAAGIRLASDGSILLIRETAPVVSGGLALSQLKVTKYNSGGVLDPSFGTSGTLTSANSFSGFLDTFKTVLPIGNKILVIGSINNASTGSVTAELYNSNGTIDTAFGTNGQVASLGTRSGGISTALLQSDGKIVIAGTVGIFRLLADGSIDSTFTNPGGIGGTPQLFQQSDGKIIIGGGSGNLIRLNATGSVDSTFNSISNNGATVVQSDDKILVGTYESGDFKVRRYSRDGVLDTTFGTSGLATVDFGGADVIKRLDIAADGRLFASGVDTNKVLSTSIFTGATAPTNQAPVVANAIADQNATIGNAFSFAVPVTAFSDPNTSDTLTYTATLADGSNTPLPTWLAFDAATRTFTGTPPTGTGNLNLRVKATDNGGLSVTDDFNIAVGNQTPSGNVTVLLADNFNTENGGNGRSAYPAINLTNWNITDGTVDIIGTDFSGREYISGHGSYLDLDGNNYNAGKIETKNTFSFAAGEEVTLKFLLAGSQRSALLPAGQDNDSVTVSLGNLFNETFTRSGNSPFEQITRTFKVNAAADAKLIFDHAGSDNIGLLLDDVELSKTSSGSGGNNGGGGSGSTGSNNGIIPGLSLASNLFQTDSTFKGFGINPISQKATQKVSEIALFAVDDLSGRINGIAPGAAGYLEAVLANAKSIFSTLSGDFFSTERRELALDANKIYQAVEIVNGSLADAKQQLANGQTPNNLLFSLPDANGNSPLKITNTANGYNLSINNDELVLAIDKLAGSVVNTPIGAKSQSSPQGRTIDLTDYGGQTLKADIFTKSSAAYNNQVGFYAVEDAIGTIKLTDGSSLKPGDANYAQEAIKLALTNSLQAGKTDSLTGQDLAGGKIYAPVVVAQGTMNDFLAQNPTNSGGANAINAYFNYLGANTDKVDHFRLLGNNTFGVEDMYGGGDRDFNDMVVKMDLKV